jgi:hypothetical protein
VDVGHKLNNLNCVSLSYSYLFHKLLISSYTRNEYIACHLKKFNYLMQPPLARHATSGGLHPCSQLMEGKLKKIF